LTDATLSQRLADYVCQLSYEQIPAEVVAKLKSVIVHDLVVGLLGSHTDEAARAVAFAHSEIGGTGESTVIGYGFHTSPLDACYVNAVMIRALRQEDTILPTGVHAGAMLISAGLAVGEQRGCSGRDVITALVAGYDVVGKLAAAQPAAGIRAERTVSHTFGAFGVAAVAAKLLGLDHDQTTRAIGYAGNLAAMITDGFGNHQYGVVTRNGLTSAYLGEARAPAPLDALEGDPGFFHAQVGDMPVQFDDVLSSLGVSYEVMASVCKPFPGTALNGIPVTLLQRLLAEHGLPADEVSAITVLRSHRLRNSHHAHSQGPWSSPWRTISSLPFALAAVLLDGQVTPERLNHPGDPDVFELAQLVEVEFVESENDHLRNVLEVRTRDGRTLSIEGDRQVLEEPDPATVLQLHGADDADIERGNRIRALVAKLEDLSTLAELMDATH
jgi:2-methylcitrate dehydratase PrpD